MPDLLCSLVHLARAEPLLDRLRRQGVHVRRPNPWEQDQLRAFITDNFTPAWAQETSVAFSRQPISCFVAWHKDHIVGWAAYECTRRNFFGPMGVARDHTKKGVGSALLLACLHGLQDMGYVYAIIGAAGPVDFYQKVCGAVPITLDDGKGIYGLKDEPRFSQA